MWKKGGRSRGVEVGVGVGVGLGVGVGGVGVGVGVVEVEVGVGVGEGLRRSWTGNMEVCIYMFFIFPWVLGYSWVKVAKISKKSNEKIDP